MVTGIGFRLTKTHSLVFKVKKRNINRIINQKPILGTYNDKPTLMSRYGIVLFGFSLELKVNRQIVDMDGETPFVFNT